MLIERGRSCLLVVDVQERLVPAMAEAGPVIRNAAILMRAARRLGVPLLVSEQYPQGLGPTVSEFKALVPEDAVLAKLSFSCADGPGLAARLGQLDRNLRHRGACLRAADRAWTEVVGLSALRRRRRDVVADGGQPRGRTCPAARCRRADRDDGELVFEWLGAAGTPEFRELSKLIK